MRRLPILPTIVVALAVAAMAMLGVWQLQRAALKDRLNARAEANLALPETALVPGAVLDEELRFRRARALCLEVVGWRRTGGHGADGSGGTRYIAECRTGAEGPGFAVDMGVSRDPRLEPEWTGGEVTGRIAAEPSRAGLWDRLTGNAPPPRPMIVSETPAPGLQPSAQPGGEIRNNSRIYAAQWFFFALVAALVYALALRRRSGGKVADEGPSP